MKFNSESELIDLLKSNLRNTYHRESVEIFDEVSFGFGIADLVICDYYKLTDDNLTRTPLDSFAVNIYHIIRNKGLADFDELYDTTRSQKKSIDEALETLIDGEYIKFTDKGFKIEKEYVKPIKYSFAIEAKLKNWQRALKQAYRYKWFAEFSYVVLDAYHAKPAIQNIEVFRKHNVGLATISKEGILVRYFSPDRNNPFDSKMQFLMFEFARKHYTLAK